MRGQRGRSLFSQRLKAGRRNRKTSRLSPGSPRKAREVAHLAGSYPGLKGWFSDAAHTRPLQKRKERGTPVELGVAEGGGPPAPTRHGTGQRAQIGELTQFTEISTRQPPGQPRGRQKNRSIRPCLQGRYPNPNYPSSRHHLGLAPSGSVTPATLSEQFHSDLAPVFRNSARLAARALGTQRLARRRPQDMPCRPVASLGGKGRE